MHLNEGPLLIAFFGKSDKAVAARLARDGVRHNLGRLAAREASLEERYEDEFVHLGAEVADEDAILGATILTARRISTTSAAIV